MLYDDIQVVESVDIEDDNYKALSELNDKLNITYRMLRYLHIDQTYKLHIISLMGEHLQLLGL